eukprot:CAMPEP_0177674244 /NCGR_PEP_ID=MMETSP0447-20121125/26435_1 /TAXON_ID=0 /ORGANISM="Stygamoeba regulata, Strain BSH-02190019" /LENGTH=73 /DNA_ID=CAMNT_0019182293 /DNA_START=94 /DNA_END=312 /DNA_ORIENTATION=+
MTPSRHAGGSGHRLSSTGAAHTSCKTSRPTRPNTAVRRARSSNDAAAHLPVLVPQAYMRVCTCTPVPARCQGL